MRTSRLATRAAVATIVVLLVTALGWAVPPGTPGGPGSAAAYPLGQGYWIVLDDGTVVPFGDAQFYGSPRGTLGSPIAAMAPYPFLEGYWLAAADGGVFAYGGSKFFGSLGDQRLNAPIVGMAATPSGRGYWLVASDGGIFAFGDAEFLGSQGGAPLNKPIVGMAATPSGKGYYLLASDGGVFTHGDAVFRGSEGARRLNKPIVGMAITPSGAGYYMVASDGGIFTHGDAVFLGSRGGDPLNSPITSMLLSTSGKGYSFVARDGGIFTYGDAPFFGSLGDRRLPSGVRTMAVRPRLALEIVPFPDAQVAVSRWMPNNAGNTTLRLLYFSGEQPAGARIAGVEGIDVSQLGAISWTKNTGGCLTWVLVYNEDGVDKRRNFTCPGDYSGFLSRPSFTPSASVPGAAKVVALQIWYNAPLISFDPMGGGPSETDDITVAGVTVSGAGVFRQT
ncbi:MAG TPA: hypothetical protein VF230_08490 [Acidimicrobiales bacterium]